MHNIERALQRLNANSGRLRESVDGIFAKDIKSVIEAETGAVIDQFHFKGERADNEFQVSFAITRRGYVAIFEIGYDSGSITCRVRLTDRSNQAAYMDLLEDDMPEMLAKMKNCVEYTLKKRIGEMITTT